MNAIVIDLDGTLANIEHRLAYLKRKPKDWEGFFTAIPFDKPNAWCIELIKAFTAPVMMCEVHIVSARPEEYFLQTAEWLLKQGITQKKITLHLVRKNENRYHSDVDLKREWLKSHPEISKRILFVVDDRQRVVDMWRSEGLTVLQCAQWDEK